MFINGYKKPKVIENNAKVLKFLKNLKQYPMKFELNGTIEAKVYLQNF